MNLTTRRLIAAFLLGTCATGHAETYRDLGMDDSNTGFAMSDQQLAEGTNKVRQYTWVCPTNTVRPVDGRVEIQHSPSMCVDAKTRSLVISPTSRVNGVFGTKTPANTTCLPATAESEEVSITTLALARLECFDAERVRVVSMIKEYDQGYFVTGGDAELASMEGFVKKDNQKAAAAAGAAVAGYYNGCHANPFLFCSLPMPDKWSPLRGCWKKICRHSTNKPPAATQ